MMRGIGGAAAGAVLGALLVTGCGAHGTPAASAGAKPQTGSATPGPSGGSAATPAGAFGREQAAADITAATTAAGLAQPKEDAVPSPSPSAGQPVTDKDARRAELAACMAPWTSADLIEDPEKAYAATIAALERRGWKADGGSRQLDMLTQTRLTKQGWVLFARRYDFSGGKGSGMGMPDLLSFFASDLACEGRFTDAEMEAALKEE